MKHVRQPKKRFFFDKTTAKQFKMGTILGVAEVFADEKMKREIIEYLGIGK